MEDDPFIALSNAFGGGTERPQSPTIMIGKVTSVNPIVVVAGGLPLNANDLFVNKLLLQRTAKLDNIDGNLNEESVSGSISGELMPFLNIGDNVLLIKESEEKHVVVCSF